MRKDRPPCERSGHAPGDLDIAAMCGLAPSLSKEHGVGRAAVVSRCFHAMAANEPGCLTMFAELTDEEQEDVRSWKRPIDVVLPSKHVLDYASSAKEVWCALDDWGFAVDPWTTPKCLTLGRLDFAWVLVHGMRTSYVADLKRSTRTKLANPDSLQLHAYGMAHAQMNGCQAYCTGIWAAVEGEWIWSSEMVELGSERHEQIWQRISAAARHTDKRACTGPHCSECYARRFCPDYLLPASMADTWLAPLIKDEALTSANALTVLRRLEQMEDLRKSALDRLKTLVSSGAVRIESEDGRQVWRACTSQGRESVSASKLREGLGEEAERFITRGAPYSTYRWTKA